MKLNIMKLLFLGTSLLAGSQAWAGHVTVTLYDKGGRDLEDVFVLILNGSDDVIGSASSDGDGKVVVDLMDAVYSFLFFSGGGVTGTSITVSGDTNYELAIDFPRTSDQRRIDYENFLMAAYPVAFDSEYKCEQANPGWECKLVQINGVFKWVLSHPFGTTTTTVPPGNTYGATFVSQSVPTIMVAGQNYNVSITMYNSGNRTWTQAEGFKLGAQSPANNTTWVNDYRAYLAPGESIPAGASKTFHFTVHAPAVAGTYAFQWQMVHEWVVWFGGMTPWLAINVVPPNVTTSFQIIGNGAVVGNGINCGMGAFTCSVAAPMGTVYSYVPVSGPGYGFSGWSAECPGGVVSFNANKSCTAIFSAIPAPTTPPMNDFNRDGKADLLWQHKPTGEVAIWYLSGPTRVGSAALASTQNNLAFRDWRPVGTGDFNGDGNLDLIWQHRPTGQVVYWLMNGVTAIGSGVFQETLNPSFVDWRLVGVADLNGDRKPDLLWQHRPTGYISYWTMNGLTLTGGNYFAGGTDPGLASWRLVQAADVTNDGKPDLIWQHRTLGQIVYWSMNGVTQTGAGTFSGGSDPGLASWRLAMAADITGDGRTDLIWQYKPTGLAHYWQMDGVNRVGSANVPYGDVPHLVDWSLSVVDE
jgi:hypothetical protein